MKNLNFPFDDQSYAILQEMTAAGHYESEITTVRMALWIMRTLQQQAKIGFSEIVVRNPDDQNEMRLKVNLLPQSESQSAR